MRWIVASVGVILLALGTAFGVGYLVLSPKLVVERQVQIDRHRSMVYPLGASLATFQEWSPWARLDPTQRYEVQGSAGPGQSARFRSASAQIGEGSYTIFAVTPHSAVSMLAKGGPVSSGAGGAQFDLTLEDFSGGALATWRVTRDCGQDPGGVLCRYINLFVEAPIGTALEQGLNRLKRLAEDLPALDISDVTVSIENRPPLQFAYVESAAEKDDPDRVVQAILGASMFVQQFFQARTTPPPGPRVVVMTRDDDRQVSFRVGFLYEGPAIADPAPPVRTGETPSGKAAKLVHLGAPVQMPTSYALFNAYLRAHRIQTDGLPWEIYAQPAKLEDGSDAKIEIFVPVK
jgi:effector-binding domain-containing protein